MCRELGSDRFFLSRLKVTFACVGWVNFLCLVSRRLGLILSSLALRSIPLSRRILSSTPRNAIATHVRGAWECGRGRVELFNINFGPNSCAIEYCWLKSLTLFKCSPQPMLLLFVTVVTVVQRPASRKWQNPRLKPEKTWGFPGIFGYITRTGRWRSSWVTARPSLLLFSRPNVSYCCWGAPLLFCCYC